MGEDSSDHIFTLVDGMVETSKNGVNSANCEELLMGDDEGEKSVASVEDQLHKEMTVYEVLDVRNILFWIILSTISVDKGVTGFQKVIWFYFILSLL